MIRSYASEDYPAVFNDPDCSVVAIAAERTFWEKATILHKEAHRDGVIPVRHSRHYYDLYKLAGSSIRSKALTDGKLLDDVVAFKNQFYPSAWAKYELAKPGTFVLSPQSRQVAALEKDYRAMAEMLFGEVPAFQTIMDNLAGLEAEINRMNR